MTDKKKINAIKWLKKNKHRLNISQIGKEIGFKNASSLSIIISDKPRANGYEPSISSEKLEKLEKYIVNFKKQIK